MNLDDLVIEIGRAPAFAVFHDLHGLGSLGAPVCKKHWKIISHTESNGGWFDNLYNLRAGATRGWTPARDQNGYPRMVTRTMGSARFFRSPYHIHAEALKGGYALMRVPVRSGQGMMRYFVVAPYQH